MNMLIDNILKNKQWYLLQAIFFSIPLGSGLGTIIGLPKLSHLFPILVTITAFVHVYEKDFSFKWAKIPKFYWWYLYFLMFHFVVTYGFVFPEQLLHSPVGWDPPIMDFARNIVFIVFTYLIVANSSSKLLDKGVYWYSLAFVITMLLPIALDYLNMTTLAYDHNGRFEGGFDNPNIFAAESLLVLTLNLFFYFYKKEKGADRLTPHYLFSFFAMIGVLMSQSRAAFGGLLMVLAFLFIYAFKRGNKRKILMYSAVLGVAFVGVFHAELKHIATRFMQHIFTKPGAETGSRFVIWSDYLHNFWHYFLTGVGQGREITVTEDNYHTWRAFQPHNKYLYTLVDFGIVGFTLFMLFLRTVFIDILRRVKKQINMKKGHVSQQVMFGTFLMWTCLLFMQGSYQNSREMWLMFAVVISYQSCYQREYEKENINC